MKEAPGATMKICGMDLWCVVWGLGAFRDLGSKLFVDFDA